LSEGHGGADAPEAPSGDPHVDRLARLFREHPAWRAAARHVSDAATSRVLFSHRPGERWHLARRGGESLLLPGDARDPDFVFRFSPAAIERLARVEGSVGAFAVELFGLVAGEDPEARVDLRIAAPFSRLVRRGYVRLLAAAGWRVLAFGARHGVRSLGGLRRLVEREREGPPEPWERDGGGADGGLRPPVR
jgi:hypothetical protein